MRPGTQVLSFSKVVWWEDLIWGTSIPAGLYDKNPRPMNKRQTASTSTVYIICLYTSTKPPNSRRVPSKVDQSHNVSKNYKFMYVASERPRSAAPPRDLPLPPGNFAYHICKFNPHTRSLATIVTAVCAPNKKKWISHIKTTMQAPNFLGWRGVYCCEHRGMLCTSQNMFSG